MASISKYTYRDLKNYYQWRMGSKDIAAVEREIATKWNVTPKEISANRMRHNFQSPVLIVGNAINAMKGKGDSNV